LESRAGDVVADVAVDGSEGLSEVRWRGRFVGFEERAEEAVVAPGVEAGDADAFGVTR
jgi:hypothetical protein